MIVVDEKDLLKLGVDKKIVKRIRQDAPEVAIPKSPEVTKNTGATLDLIKAINDLVKKPSDKGVDLSPVVEAIYNIQESQLNVMQLLEKKITTKAKKFEFTVIRNAQGSIHKITATEL
jgi:hypothetical protein